MNCPLAYGKCFEKPILIWVKKYINWPKLNFFFRSIAKCYNHYQTQEVLLLILCFLVPLLNFTASHRRFRYIYLKAKRAVKIEAPNDD